MSIIHVDNLKKSFVTKKGPVFRRKKELVKAVAAISLRNVDMLRGIIIHKHSLLSYRDSIIYIAATGMLMLFVGVLVFELTKRSVKSRGLVAGY